MRAEAFLKERMTGADGALENIVVLSGEEAKSVYEELVFRKNLVRGFEAVGGIEGTRIDDE